MKIIKRVLRRWRNGYRDDEKPGTFVADVQWERSEELRPDRLGLTDGDEELSKYPHDPWRPKRTLGPF